MSLYRKYRPQTFEDVVGQDHVARTLRNALTANPPRVAHAYLFTGPRGIGKTTNARLLAKCLNCENGPTPTPCNQCDFCVRVSENQPVMDLLEIDAASNTGVENVRDVIIDKIGMAPAQGRYRVTIIDEVHMLSTNAFNALLKTLEEPPSHAIFILATTETHKVPQTVLSRCQRFDFRRVTPIDIAKRLQHVAQSENLVLEDDAARLIARHADGALRDALTLLEQVSAFSAQEITASDVRLVVGGVPQELLDGLLESVTLGDAHATLSLLERAVDEGASFGQLTRDLTSYARDLMLLTVGFDSDSTLSEAERATRLRQAQNLGRVRLEALITNLREAEKEMRQSSDHRLLLELALVRAGSNVAIAPSSTMPAPAPALRSIPMNGAPAQTAWRQPPPAKPVVSSNGSHAEIETEKPKPFVDEHPRPFVDERAIVEDETPKPLVDESASVIDEDSARNDETLASDSARVEAETSVVDETPAAVAVDETPAPTQPTAQKRGRRITNLEEMIELWPKLLMRIRTKVGVTAVAYLHDARPVGFSDEDITLEFSKEFHHAKALEASKRLPFEEKINEVLDKPRRVRFVLAAPKAEPAPAPDEPEPESDDGFGEQEQDIIAFTQSMFGADVMGRSG